MNKEVWLPIREYVGLYEVSSYGRVRSLNYRRTGQVKVLSLCENSKGYLQVLLHKNGKIKVFKVHRLVAEAFIPNWFNEPQVNHIDENKKNNHVSNLEYCDCKYNINYGTSIKRSALKRKNDKRSKPVLQFSKTGELVKEWPSTREVGRNGFDRGTVFKCCNGRLKFYKGYIWRYKESA